MSSALHPADFSHRRDALCERALAAGIGAVIITPGADLAYLTGSWMSSHERLSALVLHAGGAHVVVPATDAFAFEGLAGVEVRTWRDGEDPYHLALAGVEAERVAVSGTMPADHLFELEHRLADAEFGPATPLLSQLMAVKEPAEIEQLAAAGAAIDRVHAQVPGLLRAGRTECDVAADLRKLILAEHTAVDFIIVGSGPNGANPHYDFGDRVLEHGDVVVVDIGGTFGVGYHSDCTRTYIVGGAEAATDEVRHAYAALHEAHARACAAAVPGTAAELVDAAARTHLTDAGLGDYFTHRTGHGIGLSTHEEPSIVAGNERELVPGMAFSVEPGVYIDGRFGMRLEDIVVLTADGVLPLNNCPRELR